MARQRGNRWQADARIDGKRVRQSFATREAAEAFERSSSLPGETPVSVVTLKDFVDANFLAIWGENKHHDFQRIQLKSIYRVMGETKDITKIDTDDVDDAIEAWKDEGLAAGSINHRLAVLSKALKYARRKKVIQHLPDFQRQRLNNTLERVWTKDDERKAFLYLDHIGLELSKHIMQFLLYTGARKGEAYALKRGDVRDGYVTFDKRITKNGKTRQIPLVPKAQEAWEALCKATDLANPLEAVNKWTFQGHWNLLRSHFDALDDRAFVPHMLRHTCATRLVAAGVPLPQVMKWMGHQSITVTMRYVYVAPKDLDVAAAALAA